MKTEFVMLAHSYKDQDIRGWYWSEKLDGVRAYWDGGISRGKSVTEIPWANTARDSRLHVSTGLWSRYGKVIHAPSWWLDKLPPTPLDGELYCGRGEFQKTVGVIKHLIPGPEWSDVTYQVFDCPPYDIMFTYREIDGPNYKKKLTPLAGAKYIQRYNLLEFNPAENEVVRKVKQQPVKNVQEHLQEILSLGGEGIILRDPKLLWVPQRSHRLLKMKGINDAEGTVTGYVWGKGKLEGLFGALVIDYKGLKLELSGFTDDERVMDGPAEGRSGVVGNDWTSSRFPRGKVVTFKYRELTNDGVPKEARYSRDWVGV